MSIEQIHAVSAMATLSLGCGQLDRLQGRIVDLLGTTMGCFFFLNLSYKNGTSMIIMIPIMIYHDISDHFWLVVGPHIKKACRIEHSYSIKSRHVLTFFGWCNLFISL